jgi:ubiquitin-conjugating enzyme E2 Z
MREGAEVQDGKQFVIMPFEGNINSMKGKFTYKDLETRLRKIREVIDDETQTWIAQGVKAYQGNDRIASNLKSQFEQCRLYFDSSPGGITLTLEMEKDNPFVWTMVHPSLPVVNNVDEHRYTLVAR